MKIAIVIPTYNEKDNIKKIIPQIFSLVPQSSLIIIDDNSPDKTADEVKKLRKKFPHLYLIKRKQKAGRGSAVIEGFKYADKYIRPQIYIEMDADFSHNPKELPQLIKSSKPKTVVLASRYVKDSQIINWPISRKITSFFANKLIRFILKLPIHDNTNGFRCYSKEAVNFLLNHQFKTQGYILLSEAAYLLSQKGFDFLEIPSVFRNRKLGKSNANLAEFLRSLPALFLIKRIVK